MPDFDVDVELVRKLADLLTETGLSELEVANGDRRIKVSRSLSGGGPPTVAWHGPAPSANVGTSAGPDPNAVPSPMVGTVYLSPEPGAPPFVKVGDHVNEGATILLIEAMKTYNPVKAPRSGTIVRILVHDGSPVEYGEELMLLKP